MKTMRLIAGMLASVLALQACSDSSSTSPLLKELAAQQDAAVEDGSIFVDFGEIYADHDKYIVVCQEAFREMALDHVGLPDDSVEPLDDSESAVVAYSPGDDGKILADVIDRSDVTLCQGVQRSAIPITQNQQPFTYSEEFRSESGSPWLRTGTDAALY